MRTNASTIAPATADGTSAWLDDAQLYHMHCMAYAAQNGIRKPAQPLPFVHTAETLDRLVESWRSTSESGRTSEQAAELARTRDHLIEEVRFYFERQGRFPWTKFEAPLQYEGIPQHDEDGLLPPGLYHAEWTAFAARFACTPRRRRQMFGLLAAMHLLKAAGALSVYVGGSFVTAKPEPGDVDATWGHNDFDGRRVHSMLKSAWAPVDVREEHELRRLRRQYFGLDIGFAYNEIVHRQLVENPLNFPFDSYVLERAVGAIKLDLDDRLSPADEFVPFSMFPGAHVLTSQLALCRASLPQHWHHISDEMLEANGVRIGR